MKMLIGASALALVAGTAAGQTWTETGDAGDGVSGFQTPAGSGALTSISGTMDWFNLNDHVDAFEIVVKDPAQFFASTDPVNGGSFIDDGGFEDDSRLFLFDSAGNLVMANDDSGVAGSSSLESTISDPSIWPGATLNSPGSLVSGGTYILAVTYFDNQLLDASGASIVDFAADFDALQGQVPGTGAPAGYSNIGDFDISWTYTISLGGANFVPTPGAAALFGIAGLAGIRRRRA